MAQQPHAVTVPLIAFQLRQIWFAVPMTAIVRVMPLGPIYGDPQHTGISVTRYDDQELTVVDVGHRIFSDPGALPAEVLDDATPATQSCLVVLQTRQGERIGLPIDSQPEVRRVPETQIVPLPETYRQHGNIHCISTLSVQAADQPPLFILDPDQLRQQ